MFKGITTLVILSFILCGGLFADASSNFQSQLTLEQRIKLQEKIEDVYHSHRIWPEENRLPKPQRAAVVNSTVIRDRVIRYLQITNMLQKYWKVEITRDRLQAELVRLGKESRDPKLLNELYDTLDHDPFLIAECLARPLIAERLIRTYYANDARFHSSIKAIAQQEHLSFGSLKSMMQHPSYKEVEFVLSGGDKILATSGDVRKTFVNQDEWTELQLKVRQIFIPSVDGILKDSNDIPVGYVSTLIEEKNRYYALVILKKTANSLKIGEVEWQKVPFEKWFLQERMKYSYKIVEPSKTYSISKISSDGCINHSWSPTYVGKPDGRFGQTAVWTGTEMIVWGGIVLSEPVNTGSRYDPATDSWNDVSVLNVPVARRNHVAVWTGTEMIIYGGDGIIGGAYNPSSDTWRPLSLVDAPERTENAVAVWTGSRMIVWGGSFTNFAGQYDPVSDTWFPVSSINAPEGRSFHVGVWTGSKLIIWGGSTFAPVDTGGIYDPSIDTWQPTSTLNAPSPRSFHTAVWNGAEMIVWGGLDNQNGPLNSGGRYNPDTETWTATSLASAPDARASHTAISTGTEMIIWGGFSTTYLNTGAKYDYTNDQWQATNFSTAPLPRQLHTAIWTGTEMIVWGGLGLSASYLDTGGRYTPQTDEWLPTNLVGAPSERDGFTSVYTGSEIVIWGGSDGNFSLDTGGIYDPATNTWTDTTLVNVPEDRTGHTAVWTGTEMIMWGGLSTFQGLRNEGARFDPVTNTWNPISSTNSPGPRVGHSAVWSGEFMIIWGGGNTSPNLNTGGLYNPQLDEWTQTETNNAPEGRQAHTAVWTGSEMIIWGGVHAPITFLNTGGKYNPITNSWLPTSLVDVPTERRWHTAVWTGSEMVIWGGTIIFSGDVNDGGRYDPITDTWIPTNIGTAPTPRSRHSAIWTGSRMIVWGGSGFSVENTGGIYNPQNDFWIPTSVTSAPGGRRNHTGIWLGDEMFIWGGFDGVLGSTRNGGRYCITSFDSPVAVDDFYFTFESQLLIVDPPGILMNDGEPNGLSLTPIQISNPNHGTLQWNGDGSFTYTPDSGFSGFDSFIYKASNGSEDSNEAVVKIEIVDVNLPPVALDDEYQTNQNTVLVVSPPGVLTNDSDPDGDSLQAFLLVIPSSGTVNLNTDGSFDYTPNQDFVGTDLFQYVVYDEIGNAAAAWVTINVTLPNSPPDAVNDSVSTTFETPILIDVLANDSDPDGDVLAISSITQPSHGTAVVNGSMVEYSPQSGFSGIDEFTYTISDGKGGADTASVSVTVGEPPCLFGDDFEDNQIDPLRWMILKPLWKEMNGVLIGSSTTKATIVSVGFLGCVQCTIDTSFRIISGSDWKLKIFGWYQNDANYLELEIKRKGNTAKWALNLRINGAVVAEASASLPVSTGTFYGVLISYDGTNFHVNVDGNEIITMASSVTSQGNIRYEMQSGGVEFSSICISQP